MKSMSLKAVALSAMLLVSALAGAAAQAQDLKIGYVNSERVIREANMAKAVGLRLEAEFGKREKDLKDLESKLRGAAEKLEKDAPTLSESERNRRQRDLVEQDRELQRKRREWQEDLSQRKQEEMSAILDRANRVVKQIFDAEKYDIMLQDAIFVGPRVDITKKVIDTLNAQK